MKTIFIDGQSGTTGLEIYDLLKKRDDLKIINIEEKDRKNIKRKKELINQVDLSILCLPDPAAIEAASLLENPHSKILDASTAHRVNPQWVYGLPELDSLQREKIKNANVVSNPGCYPTGFILAIKPLIEAQLIPVDYPISLHAVSGYSGGGKSLISSYNYAF